jgi:predicted transposase/invertase (TIGR01784 family)
MTKNLIRFDWAMKKLLRSKANFGILEGFLSELLKKDVKILHLLESESNKHDDDGKFNRVDLLVQLDGGEIVLVEVQVDTEPDYLYRMLFGTSKVIAEHLKEGEPYASVKKVYSVNILYFGDMSRILCLRRKIIF